MTWTAHKYPPLNSPQGMCPATDAELCDLSAVDGVPTPGVARSLVIGVSGDVKVDTAAGNTAVTLPSVPVGVLPLAVTKVYKAGTTADKITFLY